MLRTILCLSWFACAAAWGDVTIEGTHTPGLDGGVGRQIIYLRDDQMRIDQLAAQGAENVTSSVLIRLSGTPAGLLFINHESKRIELLSSLPATSSPGSGAGSVRVVKRDETRKILGHTASGMTSRSPAASIPLALLGEQLPQGMAGMVTIKLNVSGTSWVVPGMDGAAELADFFAVLAGRQLSIAYAGQNPPGTGQQMSLVSAGLSGALTAVMKQITRSGMPLVTQTTSVLSPDMEGMMADVVQGLLDAAGLGDQQSTESIVTAVHSANLSAGTVLQQPLARRLHAQHTPLDQGLGLSSGAQTPLRRRRSSFLPWLRRSFQDVRWQPVPRCSGRAR